MKMGIAMEALIKRLEALPQTPLKGLEPLRIPFSQCFLMSRASVVRYAFIFFAAAAVTLLNCGSARADVLQDVDRIFELHAKLTPGMTIDALSEMLGPPAETHALEKTGETPNVTRYAWLHGQFGIEAYEVEGTAYRVAITLPCGSDKNQLRALDALTRQGRSKYGSMPLSDPRTNEYYWTRDGVRFAFSRYNRTTVLSSATKAN